MVKFLVYLNRLFFVMNSDQPAHSQSLDRMSTVRILGNVAEDSKFLHAYAHADFEFSLGVYVRGMFFSPLCGL